MFYIRDIYDKAALYLPKKHLGLKLYYQIITSDNIAKSYNKKFKMKFFKATHFRNSYWSALMGI